MNTGNLKKAAKNDDELMQVLEHIVFAPVNFFTPFTRALCIFIGGRNNYHSFIDALKSKPYDDTEFVMIETRNFVLQAI